jgi:tetratricopeptide (TPR) repeat protein
MKKTFVTLLIALSASAHGYAQTSSEAVSKAERNTIRQGNEYFEKGNYAKALEAYETALRLNTTSQVATYNKALALLNMASEDTKGSENDPRMQAMQLFEQVGAACAKTDSPLAEKAFYNLGNMAYNDEDYAKSIERYKQALRLNPGNNLTRQNLRLAQLKQQQQQQDKDKQEQEQEQQQQQNQQEQQNQEQQQQEQQQQQQPMTQSAEQILQAMQNKENATRRKQKEPAQPGLRTTDKPW